MGKSRRIRKIGYRAVAVLLAVCVVKLAMGKTEGQPGLLALGKQQALQATAAFWSPSFSYVTKTRQEGLFSTICSQFPVFKFLEGHEEITLQSESSRTYEEIILAEGQDEYTDRMPEESLDTPLQSEGRVTVQGDLEELLRQENQQAQGEGNKGIEQENAIESAPQDIPLTQESSQTLLLAGETGKQQEYQWDYYRKYDTLVKEFYAVDASTAIDESQLNLEALLGRDLSIQKREDDAPQILIYHTHSQEAFADSVEGDPSTTIVGVGEVLAQLLRDGYGYNVMHHLGQYDVQDRDYAYNNSLPALEQLLEEYPSIEVVIDLHRDEVAADRKLVTEIEGRPTAMFMFFNGLSRTRKHGDIEYLPNENIADNLAFSFQMQTLCNQYYPGLTRRIYLKGYRYNMHVKPRCLLIEMGAQTNTYEECYNACLPLARILHMELSGTDFAYTP